MDTIMERQNRLYPSTDMSPERYGRSCRVSNTHRSRCYDPLADRAAFMGDPQMHTFRRAAYAAAVSMAVTVTAACGAGAKTTPAGSAVPAHPAPSAPASSSGHKAPATVSESQLETVASLRDPSFQADASANHTGVVTLKYLADVGGPECTVFLNAVNESGLAYHSLAEVDRGYDYHALAVDKGLLAANSGVQIELILTSYASVADAQQVVGDLRTSAKSCAKLHYTINGQSLAMSNMTSMPLAAMGDDSTAVRASFSSNGNTPTPMAVDMIREGTVVLGVYLYNDTSPSRLLQEEASTAADDLQFQETRWAS